MATFNNTASATDLLSSSVAVAAAAEHYERSTAAATTFIVPTSATNGGPLQLEPFIAGGPHFVTTTTSPMGNVNGIHSGHQSHHHNPQSQQSQQHHHQQTNATSTSYTFVQIKREPCQVSEVTSANCHQSQQQQQQQQQHHVSTSSTSSGIGVGVASSSTSCSASIAASGTSKTMSSSSTLTTLVKIEASSPKVPEMDKASTLTTLTAAPTIASTNNSVPIGIAVARKRPQESGPLTNSTAIPMQQTLNKDLNCFGIRVADLGGVGGGCNNIYFTGNGDLVTGSATADELGLSAAGVQSVNRTPSTYWQYPNALPIESVISMSPATVGLQYSREASRGQVVLLPATPALGISNFPIYTPTDPFQQAAAFVWPSYIPQGTTPAAAAAAATLQPPPNFIFPSMSPHSTLQPQPYATSLQLFGSNYLTAAAAAAAAAAATSTLCQHNQQTNSATSSINLSLTGGPPNTTGGCTTSSSSSSSRFLSVATAAATATPGSASLVDTHKTQKTLQSTLSLQPPAPPQSTAPLILPPAAMKIEEWNTADFMSATAKTTTTTLAAATHPIALNFEARDKTTTTTTTNLLDLQNAANAQALNLMRLPTPPTSATMETAAVAAAAPQLQPQILFQATSSPSPALLNLSATLPRGVNGAPATPAGITTNFLNNNATLSASIGPPTPLGDDTAINFKTSPQEGQQPQIVVGVPRVLSNVAPLNGSVPQMQDVNIQTDTPVCSDDENSSCTLAIQQLQQHQIPSTPLNGSTSTGALQSQDQTLPHESDTQQPLELTKHHTEQLSSNMDSNSVGTSTECHHELETVPAATTTMQITNGETLTCGSTITAAPTLMSENNYNENHHEANVSSALALTTDTGSPIKEQINVPTNNQTAPEDLTGLELLSNISTSTLANKAVPIVRVKQEPLDQTETTSSIELARPNLSPQLQLQQPEHTPLMLNLNMEPVNSCGLGTELQGLPVQRSQQLHSQSTTPPTATAVEPLGGLNLLCALAEQRIQEEVQSSGGNLFGTTCSESDAILQPTPRATPSLSFQQSQQQQQQQQHQSPFRLDQPFPSMEGIELPSTSGLSSNISNEPVKRKKHKHSRSSKSSSNSGKKSQRCSKKSKKKYSKEKRKHKLLSAEDLDFDDEQLQQELKSAFNRVDPNFQMRYGQWNAQELFTLMESDMRMRLAYITREYHKKKRKLNEISKNKKKKKCSKLLSVQQQQQNTLSLTSSATLTLGATSSGLSCSSTSLPLCDYKFPKFSNTTGSVGSSTTSAPYLNRSSFLRFGEKAPTTQTPHVQFPPVEVNKEDNNTLSVGSSSSSMTVYKPVRLGPSALAGAVAAASVGVDSRGSSILRLAQKHPATEKSGSQTIVCKEPKLMAGGSSSRRSNESNSDERSVSSASPMPLKMPAQQQQQQQQQQQRKTIDPMDRQLSLTSDHLYSKETRVLTDMGGLFYAGVMKPLQPPDIYAITLDGERGNKSHIMSREEIFKDTILEVAPKSIESVPVGTRVCAYWSQQYRCLYPGRAIESESSEDGDTQNDFVSVEFDDGDSGRIRLQNIRFLLSDYPIVEYNDNPLYSLGKQKKTGSRSGNHPVTDSHLPHDHPFSTSGLPNSTCSETQINARDIVQRKEKKRIKNLKKKSQTTLNSNSVVASTFNGVSASNLNSTSNGIGSNDGLNECNHKHRKHKKHKKHKKHHHRKIKGEDNECGGTNATDRNTFVIKTSNGAGELPLTSAMSASTFSSKNESCGNENGQQIEEDDEEAEIEAVSVPKEVQGTTSTEATAIKMEVANGAKVKTENLDLEEESTSNMMSEMSDENKGDDDEVEHNNSKGSKIAAFLPERQLWGWQGKAYRKAGMKGRARKQFYKTIKRGKETITVGDCAVFLSTGRPDRPYIGRIESMWETTSSNKVVRVRWFYHPEETTGCPNLKYPGALFESPHEDENDVQTISHRCEVLPFERYFGKYGADSKQYQSIYDNNDTYYLAGYYNPRLQVLNLQNDIPTLKAEREQQNRVGGDNATVNV